MSTASKKEQPSAPAAAAAAATSGSGGSAYFRRKKIVPAVVARKISNNNSKNSTKIASSKENSKNVPTCDETLVPTEETTEPSDVHQLTWQLTKTTTDVTPQKNTSLVEESKGAKMPDTQKGHATSKPAAALVFRRIKPKVVIPQTQKPAKSILKNSMTPVKGNSSTESANYAVSSNETTPKKDPKVAVHPDGEISTAKQTPISEEMVKAEQSSGPESKLATLEEKVESVLCKANVVVDSVPSEDVAKAEESKKCTDAQNSTALERRQLNSSIPPNVAVVSIPDKQATTRQHIPDALAKPENPPSNAIAPTAAKTIKRTISLKILSPEIANLLKSSLGKKATKGTKSLNANGKAAVSKPPDLSKQLPSVSLLPQASQADQENQSTQLVVVESNKPSTESNVSGSSTGDRLPVLETRVDNISSKESIVTKPPSPAKPHPAPAKLPTGEQVTGVKKIQKVHLLSAEQQRLVMNSLKKGKAKRAVKIPNDASVTKDTKVAAASVTKDTNMAVSHEPVESTPNPVSSVSKDEYRVNIISHIILPRLTVSSLGEAAQQNVLNVSDESGSVPAASHSSSTDVPTSSSQQATGRVAETLSTATVPSNNSNQYPKIFICHKPASPATFSGEPKSSSIPNFPSPIDPVEARSSHLVQPSVSVTVLPTTNHITSGYPNFINSVPTRPYFLPTPVVTVRPTSPKHAPHANTSPPILPTPIISVTVSPMNSSNSSASPMDVLVSPRIVPKIVIDGCDAVDHDSQSSLASTSSSSSSGQNASVSKQQSNDRTVSTQSTEIDSPNIRTGCSPGTLDRLRAKSLKNLRKKIEAMSGIVDKHSYENPVRQYGHCYERRSNLQSLRGNNEPVPQHIITMQRIKECLSKHMEPANSKTIAITSSPVTKRTADNHVQRKASTVSDNVSEATESCEQAKVPEMNEFLGFSISSIECAERDFEDRARTIDLVLAAKRKSLEDSYGNEISIEEIETSALIEGSKRESTQHLPGRMEEIREESVAKAEATKCVILSTDANDQNRADSTDLQKNLKSADTPKTSLHDESETNTRKIESQVASLQDEDAAVKKALINVSAPSETALEVSAAIILDIDERIENESEKHIEMEEQQGQTNTTSRNETNVPQEGVVDVIRSGEDVTPTGSVSEPENTPNSNSETMMEEEHAEIPVPDLIDEGATGVDVIMAMAKLRRQNRVLSLDDASDREHIGWMDEPIAAPAKPTSPSTSGRQLVSKKKRKKRRKKRRDKFVQLLLKHVNYDSLIEDIVRKEKRRYNYKTSSDEEVLDISPLQRYIREQERSAATVEFYSHVSSSPAISSEDNESLVEETILNRILSKRSCVSAASVPASATLKVAKSAECSSTPQNFPICIGSDSTTPHGEPDDQSDDVQLSIVCDTVAKKTAEAISKAPTSRESSDVEMVIVDRMPQAKDDFSREGNKSCDIVETNAATCDTPSGAVADKEATEASSSPSKVIEMSNTHAEQVEFQRRMRRTILKRVSSSKRPAKRLANRMASYAITRKRSKYNITPPVDMLLFDSLDGSNNDEVVSDCSSGGLSTGEAMVNSSTRKSLPPRKSSTDNGNGSVEGKMIVDVGAREESNKTIEGKVLPGVAVPRDTLNRSGRSRKSGRRHSSSSNSISSSTRHNSLSCDGDLSSSDDTKPGRRRKLRRKKRSTRGITRANRLPEVGTIIATVDCNTNRSMSTTASSCTTNISFHLPTASTPSKASNLDAQYVITEVTAEPATASPRVLDVINVRNNRVLPSRAPSTRANRTTNVQSEPKPQVPAKNAQKRDRNRSAKSNQVANADSEGFITPNIRTDWSQQEQHPTANDSDCEPASSEPMDAAELENQLVKCGNCGKEMLQSVWKEHYTIHNGATFRVGIDFQFDLKDFKAVAGAIGRFMKLHRRAEVACERCGTVKKSGLGMASHMNQCGLSEHELEQTKASCEHCGRKMKAVSMLVHQQQHCRVLKEQQRQIAFTTPMDDAVTTKETTASGRKKRKSVASAERKIKTIAKEINDELNGELVLEIYGRGVSNAIMQCWLSHLKQSSEAVCASVGCPFVGMKSEHMRTEYNDDGTDPKPLYQCAKCAYMSTKQKPIYEHLSVVHPQTFRRAAEQRRTISSCASDGDSDVFMASGDGSASADDTYSSSALEEEDEGGMGGKSKKGRGKKQTGASSNKSKSKKSSESPKGNSKKNAGKQAGNKAILSELLDSSMAISGTEETEVYKEMVLQESIEYKQVKGNYNLMSVSWTQEFRREHYAARLLFSELRPDVDTSYLRSIHNVRDYLPKATRSMRYVQCNSKQYDPGYEPEMFANRWQQKNTFDGEALGCESFFYCGGPVVSLDWLPLPDDGKNDCDQFLAVACKQSYDEYYNGEQLAVPRSRKCLVQIWNVGPIQNVGSTKVTLRCPRLAFAIACEYGPIWQVAFCPSGCYNDPAQDDNLDRLGLLAVAGSDGDVHLYALSRSMVETENETSTAPRILHLRPVLLLSLSVAVGPQNHPAPDFTGRSVVRIAWTREKGHNVVAAGYSNGVVAVWNLAATSPLLCGTKNGIRTLLPVHKVLHSSSGCITALDLYYSSGSRYLVVCNADRRLKLYDLRSSLYQPQESLSIIMRSRIASIRWLLHFPVLVIAYDDALYIDRCAYSVHQPRDIGLRMFSIFTVASEMTDLGTNDWHSMNAVATSGGDLICHRPVPFVHGMNYKKLAQILTTTIPMKIIAIDDSADVSRYSAFSEKYGLLFSDTDKVPTAMDTTALHLKTWRRAKFNHYPAIRLNQIRWNPNSFSYTYYAIGYQAGFVRVRVLRS